MKKRLLVVVLTLAIVVGSFNVVYAGSVEETLIEESYACAYAYAECDDYTGYASTDYYPTSQVTSKSSYVSADLYTGIASIGDSASDSSASAGTLNICVELSYYGAEAIKVKSYHEVTVNNDNINKELNAYR